MEEEHSSSSFKIGETPQERGFSYVPDCYVIPSSHRPSSAPETAFVPTIDWGMLRQDAAQRTSVIKQVGNACRRLGFFQIVNHGISQSIMDGALSTAFDFFELPMKEKVKHMSNDIYKPVRYGTGLKDGEDKVQFWRVFLKHYANPLTDWIHLWPNNPPHYRENMGKYCGEVRNLALELMGVITESLGLGPTYNHITNKIENGVQVIAVNYYPPCPNPDIALGLPPHSDYSCFTLVLQSSTGLEIANREDSSKWQVIPEQRGALEVHVGDHVEVLSNGIYKSVVHRATLHSSRKRVSIASLHSLGMDDKMGVAKELVDEENPPGYKESSFRDFLNFLSKNDIAEGKSFIDSIRINKNI
ncbi:oxidoreductase family protein [Tripterygium wilfordii]|uniref:Oxidoreductase family protein n=1 Tax=Tripterygium wilfordii TaxID=458696 RepID=A0A7J7CAT4_TRIWF|nr:flavanone 3-dioxygenase 3 [Tripterygium wilfordii]KAF5731035.1 oxidoreductase family protein [Tripterygium wilfordii]